MNSRASVLATTAAAILRLDDHFAELPLPFPFPFQGRLYSSVFVNSNGSLTFGNGDFDRWPTGALFLNGPPRIAPNWTNMSPRCGGTITVRQASGLWIVDYDNVPEIGSVNTSTFSVTLSDAGRIEFHYGANAGVDGMPRLVGVTPGGGGADPGEIDLSTAGALSAVGTTYEVFAGFEAFGGVEFDLDFRTLSFEP